MRSIKNKLNEVSYFVNSNKNCIQLIAVTETWLSDDIGDCVVEIPNFTLIRHDRFNRTGGGVCIWCHNSLNFEHFKSSFLPPVEVETILIIIHVFKLAICLIYVPPGLQASVYKNVNNYLKSIYDEVLNLYPSFKMTFLGDFNKMDTTRFETLCAVQPIITENTRKDAILDQIFIDDCFQSILTTEIMCPFGESDHNVIFIKSKNNKPTMNNKSVHTVYDLRQSNVDLFVKSLNDFNFKKLFDSSDINEKVNILHNACKSALNNIPQRKVWLTVNDKQWMTPKIKIMINDKWSAYRSKNFSVFNHLKLRIKQEIFHAKCKWAK